MEQIGMVGNSTTSWVAAGIWALDFFLPRWLRAEDLDLSFPCWLFAEALDALWLASVSHLSLGFFALPRRPREEELDEVATASCFVHFEEEP